MSHRVLKNTNLKASEIRDALATGGGIVSNDTLSFFKADAKINIWSKFKPLNLQHDPDFVQAFDENREYYDPEWWRGENQDCGIEVNSVRGGITVFVDHVRNGNYYWVYKLPEKPFRLTDFCSYDIDAKCPVDGELLDHYWVELDRITFNFDYTVDLPDTNLKLEDIRVLANEGLTSLKDYYLGILLWKEDSNGTVKDILFPTSTDKLGVDNITMTLTGLNAPRYYGEWNAMPYLSSEIQELNGDGQVATYTTLNIAPKKIFIHGPGELIITVTNASYTLDELGNADVQYEIYVKNQDSSAKENINVNIFVYFDENDNALNGSAGVEVGGGVKSFPIDRIEANTTVSYYSENYNIEHPNKIAPVITIKNFNYNKKDNYWIGSQVEGFATTWAQLDEAEDNN